MAVLDGNLTTVTIVDADLEARRSRLDRYRDAGENDWSKQIAAGTADALTEFSAVHNHDPVWCIAVRDDAWKRILCYHTLRVIFGGLLGEDMSEEEATWQVRSESAMDAFQYRLDSDESGTLDTSAEEDERKVGEVRLFR